MGVNADIIFINGNIITVDEHFSITQAVAVKDGLILEVGTNEAVEETAGSSTEIVDLKGKTMMPGIIDSHGHLGMEIKIANWANLRLGFYDNNLSSIDAILDKLCKHKETCNLSGSDYILGFGYHESRLIEKRFLNKFDLDQVSYTQPVIVANISLHTFSFNSAALLKIGVDETTPDPDNSKIYRIEGSNEPTGVIQGPLAQELVFNLDIEKMEHKLEAYKKAEQTYFSAGITTACEGKSTVTDMEVLEVAARAGSTVMDVVCFIDYTSIDEALSRFMFKVGQRTKHVHVCGIKIISDGTMVNGALLSRPFERTADDYGIEYVKSRKMEAALRKAVRNNWQFCVHAMGDAAIDKLMDVYEKVSAEEGSDPSQCRNIINHAMGLRPDQLDRVKSNNLIISFYPSATAYLFEVYCMTIGRDRAERLNPMRSAMGKGILSTMHNDAPIVGPDPFIILWSAVNRVSVNGNYYGVDECITVEEGLKALTINGAIQHREEHIKGSIEKGKQADMLILNENPLSLDPADLNILRPLVTIKDGAMVYSARY